MYGKRFLNILCIPFLCAHLLIPGAVAQDLTTEQRRIGDWLSDFTAKLVADGELAGASTAVTLPDGVTLRASAGWANSEQPMRTTHRMLGGSTGKTYAAALVLAMAEDGRINLSDKLEDYLGGRPWYRKVPNASTVTIQSLLNHSSGIPHYINDWGFIWSFAIDRLSSKSTAYSPEEMLAFILGEPAVFPVGKGHYYSDLNYFLLGLLLEELTGKSYYDLLQAEILNYLRLTDTVPSNTRVIPRLATGYAEANTLNTITGAAGPTIVDGELLLDPAIEWTGGGLATTAGDLSRFYFHLGQGNVPGVSGIDALTASSVAVAEGSSTHYGNGVYCSERDSLGRYISHSGWYPGYSSNVAYFDKHNFSVAIQVNQDSDVDIYTPIREIASGVIQQLSLKEGRELSYSLVVAGKSIGSQHLSLDSDNEANIHYTFTSQGKLADINITMDADTAGIPSRMHRSGKALLYYDIDEIFAIENGRASWQSRLEEGSSENYKGKYFVPYDLLNDGASAPAELAMLARAALLRKDGKPLPLLPTGFASVKAIGWLPLTYSEGEASLETQLVKVSGLGLSPSYIWLDANNFSFAEHSGGSVIRSGWEHAIAQQSELQEQFTRTADAANLQQLRNSGIDSAQQAILLKNTNVFDPQTLDFSGQHDVLIRDGIIADIAPTIPISSESDFTVIEAEGQYVIPGFWDMHVHLSRNDLLKHLAWGVTTVRDLGNRQADIDRLYEGISTDALIGPNIIRAGFIDKAGPRETAVGALVNSLDEALIVVDHYAVSGYQQIKLYGAIEADWVKPLAVRAHQHGMRLGGHVPIDGTTERAIIDGYEEITHFIYMWLNFAPEPVDLELSFNTAKLAIQHPRDSAEMRQLIDLFLEHQVVLDPTLAIYSDLLEAKPGQLKRSFTLLHGVMPVQTERAARSGALGVPEGMEQEQLSNLFREAVDLVGDMHRAGVDIVVGTDHRILPGAALHTEMSLLSDAGISNGEILELATSKAATLMGMGSNFGTVEAGKNADLLILNANPVEDIRATTSINAVIKGGVLYYREALQQAFQ